MKKSPGQNTDMFVLNKGFTLKFSFDIMTVSHTRYFHIIIERGDSMTNTNLEITQKAIEDFRKIQNHMILAKKENATETYKSLKDEYISLKSFLAIAGVNLTELDRIKE